MSKTCLDKTPLIARVILLAMAMLLVSCGKPISEIPGRWQQIGGETIMEFRNDGSLLVNAGGVPVTGHYAILDEQHVKIEYEGFVGGLLSFSQAISGQDATLFKASISGNTLRLTDIKDKTWKYKRLD
jgi:hypothetical protein